MNELIIGGMACGFILLLCIVTSIVESWSKICDCFHNAWNEVCDWCFDVSTAYYKFKAQRARKKAMKARCKR